MRRVHDMPFGALPLPDGGTRFRLWAPGVAGLTLRLDPGGAARDVPLSRGAYGWFDAVVAGAPAGTRYVYVLDGGETVPDPASRFQPEDVHGASEVVDPAAFEWPDRPWAGRPWEETVLYELHVGTFTRDGTYAGVAGRLDHLASLGVTAVELMPLAEAPGARNWGYDGVQLFAPEHAYGRPEALKALVAAAHARGLMVFLDVVYNHFGPEGNYLHRLAPAFFTERHHTPWGGAIDFDGESSRTVRDFFIHNALYWIEEFAIDGLRFDAVHAIRDESHPDILTELAETVRARVPDRPVHLVLENDDNRARYLRRADDGRPRWYTAQWNDDVHHVLHATITGETGGYYADYADRRTDRLGRCLTAGFDYQGEPSAHRGGAPRGEPSGLLPPTAFVSFLQNHDQIGNRAFGERISRLAPPEAVRAAVSVCLLAPAPPLLFMGEEWGAEQPFPFFCDFGPELAQAVREGRRREFEHFPEFADPAAQARIPDPQAESTFAAAVLDWTAPEPPPHRDWLAYFRDLLQLRAREIVPRLPGIRGGQAAYRVTRHGALVCVWRLGDGAGLMLVANLTDNARPGGDIGTTGQILHATHAIADLTRLPGTLPPWFAAWLLDLRTDTA